MGEVNFLSTHPTHFSSFFTPLIFYFLLLLLQKKQNKNEGEKKKNDGNGGAKKEDSGLITVVLKVDLHCEGCGSKVVKYLKGLDGICLQPTPTVDDFIIFVFAINRCPLFWFGLVSISIFFFFVKILCLDSSITVLLFAFIFVVLLHHFFCFLFFCQI